MKKIKFLRESLKILYAAKQRNLFLSFEVIDSETAFTFIDFCLSMDKAFQPLFT